MALRRRSLTARVELALALAIAASAAACDGVLGLSAPTLNPCSNAGACTDGAPPTTLEDAGSGPADATIAVDASDGAAPGSPETSTPTDARPGPDAADASADTGPIIGIRCGGGSSPAMGCNADPVCCLDVDASPATYTCETDAAACGGYPIECATYNDCPGSDVCCRFASAIKCVAENACSNDALVCDPSGSSDQCPSGWKCNVAFTDGTYTLPYYGCSQ